MAFNHRKMITDSIGIHISEACERACDPERTRDGYCPTSCLSLCPPICYRSILTSLTPPPDPPTSDQNPNKSPNFHLLPTISLSILATACFLFCCYTSFRYFQKRVESRNRIGRRRRSSERQEEETHGEFLDQDHGPVVDHPIWYIRTIGLQSSVINSIAICKYKRGEGLVEGTECSVCLNEFEEDETLRLLPKCNHAFHIPCIDTWLRSHTNCPLCRAGIVGKAAGTPTPLPVQAVNDPVAGEENRVVVLESGGEGRREMEDRECDLRRGIEEEEGEREVETGGKGPGPEASKEEEMVQPMRRSVSMDSVSASMLSLAIANSHLGGIDGTRDSQKGKSKESDMGIVPKRLDANHSLLKLVGSSSISMKRSLSSSGKVFFSRYGRGWNPSLPSRS